MIQFEDVLIQHLGHSAKVDGHDMGSGERNIFVVTSAPLETFSRIKPLLVYMNHLSTTIVAYRQVDSETYTVLWPEGSEAEFTIA